MKPKCKYFFDSSMLGAIFFLLFFLVPFIHSAQFVEKGDFKRYEVEKVSPSDFTVPDSSYEKEDGAIYLYNLGYSRLEYDPRGMPELSLSNKARILILNETGFKMADRVVSLYIGDKNAQTISGVRGKVYNLVNGNIESEKLKKSDWEIVDYDERHKLARFSFRNVKVGSIIELDYTIHDPFVFQMDDWDFQLDVPVLHSQFIVSYPSNFGYKILKLGKHPLHNSRMTTKRVMRGTGVAANFDYDQVNYFFSSIDIPALKTETFTDSKENYRSTILTELHYYDNNSTGERTFFYKDWRDAITEYYELDDNRRFIESKELTPYFAREANDLSDVELMTSIYDQVRSSLRSTDDEGQIVMDRRPDKILKSGSATVNEINMVLVNALRSAGLDAYPLLYAKRNRKKVLSEFPLFSQFKSIMAIVYLDESYFLLDASDLTLTPGEIREISYNGEGLVAKPNAPQWIPLESRMATEQRCSVELVELEENIVRGELRIEISGIYADRVRHFLDESSLQDLQDFFRKPEGVRLEYKSSNLEEYADKVSVHFSIEIVMDTFGESYVFPAVVVEPISKNPFDKDERLYPIIFPDNWIEKYTCLLRLDDSKYDVAVPQSKNLILPGEDAQLSFMASYNFGSLVVRSTVSMNRSIFENHEHSSLRTFYDHVVGAQSSFIEIAKK